MWGTRGSAVWGAHRRPGTTRGAGRMGSPDHSGQFSWPSAPAVCTLWEQDQVASGLHAHRRADFVEAAASRDGLHCGAEGLWPQHHLATECGL